MFEAFRRPLILIREAEGAYADGVWAPGTLAISNITASVQPIDGKTMQIVPEGRRQDARYRIYTDTLLMTAAAATATSPARQADRVTLDGVDYEVVAVLAWQNGVIPHYEAVLAVGAG